MSKATRLALLGIVGGSALLAGGCIVVVGNSGQRSSDSRLLAGESAKRIGVEVTKTYGPVAAKAGVAADRSCVIQRVIPGSAAQRAGLRSCDLVIAINGIDEASIEALQQSVLTSAAGETLTLRVIRSGQTIDVPVTVEQPCETRD